MSNRSMHSLTGALPRVCVIAAILAFAPAAARAEPAKGTVTQGSRSAAIKHAWLVAGPDAVDRTMVIRRLVLSATDIGAKLAACTKMSCTDSSVEDGMTVDLDAGPRLNYWVALNGQKVQYSGTEPPASLEATANDKKRLAGRLRIDRTGSGGPKVDVEFDAPMLKTFTVP
jgi:hypothetical protein